MKDLQAAANAFAKRLAQSASQGGSLRVGFEAGAAWQRERDIEIAFGLCDNDTGNEVADEIRATAFDGANENE